jgi:hypothetical protein
MVALWAGSRMISVVAGDLNCGSRPETAPASTSGIALFSTGACVDPELWMLISVALST